MLLRQNYSEVYHERLYLKHLVHTRSDVYKLPLKHFCFHCDCVSTQSLFSCLRYIAYYLSLPKLQSSFASNHNYGKEQNSYLRKNPIWPAHSRPGPHHLRERIRFRSSSPRRRIHHSKLLFVLRPISTRENEGPGNSSLHSCLPTRRAINNAGIAKVLKSDTARFRPGDIVRGYLNTELYSRIEREAVEGPNSSETAFEILENPLGLLQSSTSEH